MIIGGETEYGLFVYHERGSTDSPRAAQISDITQRRRIAHMIVEEIERLGIPALGRTLEGIDDIATHTRIEELLRSLFEGQGRIMPDNASFLQRLGLTGYLLGNGARFYVDMGHPEYSIPETTNPYDALVAQKAGDWIVEECRRRVEARLRRSKENKNLRIRIDKNNTDMDGKSYAGHENYGLQPSVFKKIVAGTGLTELVIKLFVMRQIITGAGKVGSAAGKPVPYQISQRADFLVEKIGLDTVQCRGIINTRDIPYADPALLRRFHVIVGDSNMSDLSIFLKFGITALFFRMIEDGFLNSVSGSFTVPLKNPVLAVHNVSRDVTLRRPVLLSDGTRTTALEFMMQYCDRAQTFVEEKSLGPVWQKMVTFLREALNGLNTDRQRNEISRSLDWAIKERLLDELVQKTGIEPLHRRCYGIDFQYHNTNPEDSIYTALCDDGSIMTIATDREIEEAIFNPFPHDTRAWTRGELICRFEPLLKHGGWDLIQSKNHVLALDDPRIYPSEEVQKLLKNASSLERAFELLGTTYRIQQVSKENEHAR